MNLHSRRQWFGRLLAAVFCCAAVLASGTVCAQAAVFTWPTPGISYMYRGFGNGHYGLDIAADKGTKIYCSGAGTVMEIYTGCNNYDGAKTGTPCNTKGICNPSKGYYKDGYCNSAYGNAVIVRHDNGIWTAYAHLTSVDSQMKVGGRVSQGQLVGIAGSTGRSTGAHLHYEMRKGSSEYFWLNTAFDPLTMVSADDTPFPDTTAPVISNVRIYGVSQDGYYISCTATDDSGIAKVVFPTWTTANGQDDLKPDWTDSCVGTKSGDTWSYYVKISGHGFESGVYTTHIYAYDTVGNQASVNAGLIEVPAPQAGSYQTGDVNLDGTINAADALLVLQQSARIISLDAVRAGYADPVADGIINAEDALWILKKAAQLI